MNKKQNLLKKKLDLIFNTRLFYPMNIKPLLEGLLTFLPGCSEILTKATLGTDSPFYCYSVWMRHAVKTRPYLKKASNTVIELGPGDSLGTGLAALISGAKRYIALDVIKHANLERNIRVFNDLLYLFSIRHRIPDSTDFPKIIPLLDDYELPKWIQKEKELISEDSIKKITNDLSNINNKNPSISYLSPELAETNLPTNSVDLIFSQAVLEHAENLFLLYKKCFDWLSPYGIMSHAIDFKSHGTALVWNGHWTYSSLLWRMMRGRRPYLINREPLSTHLRLMREAGFEIILVERHKTKSNLKTKQLAKAFSNLDQDDLTTSGAYIIAQKPCEVT